MTKYHEIIDNLKVTDYTRGEYMEEEIDIMIHKLKFLSVDNYPKVIFISQDKDFLPQDSVVLEEKVNVAGGQYRTSWDEKIDCIIFLQANDNLYSQLPNFLKTQIIRETSAYKNNNIYIIQKENFNQNDEDYLHDTEILAEILQPKYFFYGHDGTGWVKFDIL